MLKMKINWDALGVTASLACAIHCAVLPLLGISLPLLGVDLVQSRPFEFGMIALAFVIGIYALTHGFRKHHHRLMPLVVFSIGFVVLVVKEFFHDHALWFVVPAVACIVYAHYQNYQLCRKASHCHSDDCNH